MMLTPAGIEITIIAAVIAFITNMLNKVLVNRDRMEEIQEKIKESQREMKEAQKENNVKKLEEINKQIMPLMTEQMKMSFKPMMYTFLPIIIIISWMGSRYGELGFVAEGVPVFNSLGWLGLYILTAFIITIPMEIAYKKYRKSKKKKREG